MGWVGIFWQLSSDQSASQSGSTATVSATVVFLKLGHF